MNFRRVCERKNRIKKQKSHIVNLINKRLYRHLCGTIWDKKKKKWQKALDAGQLLSATKVRGVCGGLCGLNVYERMASQKKKKNKDIYRPIYCPTTKLSVSIDDEERRGTARKRDRIKKSSMN